MVREHTPNDFNSAKLVEGCLIAQTMISPGTWFISMWKGCVFCGLVQGFAHSSQILLVGGVKFSILADFPFSYFYQAFRNDVSNYTYELHTSPFRSIGSDFTFFAIRLLGVYTFQIFRPWRADPFIRKPSPLSLGSFVWLCHETLDLV